MKPIQPISEANCKEHFGKPVLVVLKDGGEIVGILTGFGNGQITLNGEASAASGSVKSLKGTRTKGKKGKPAAGVSGLPYGPAFYPPAYPYRGGIVLDLALIALLFALL